MRWMLLPFRRYASFGGRAPRREFWMWVLFVAVVAILLSFIDSALGLGGATQFGPSSVSTPTIRSFGYNAGVRGGWLAGIFTLIILMPTIAVSVRRLHDSDRSGWWVAAPLLLWAIGLASGFGAAFVISAIAMLLYFVSSVALLVFYCLAGTPGPNRFGPDPYTDGIDLAETFR